MMRRWNDSAVRARAWAPPARGRGELRGTGLRFDLLRRGRMGAVAQLTLHAHYRIAVGINLQVAGSTRIRERSLHERSTELRQVLIRQASLRTVVRDTIRHAASARAVARADALLPPAAHHAAPGARAQDGMQHGGEAVLRLRGRGDIYRLHLLRTERHVERLMVSSGPAATVLRIRQHGTHRHERLLRTLQLTAPSTRRTPVSGQPEPHVPELLRAERLRFERRTLRSERQRTMQVRTLLRSVTVPSARTTGHAAAPASAPPQQRLQLVARPVMARPMANAVPTFAATPQPLAGPPRVATPAPPTPPVDRIERTLRESMTKVVRHTVRHEVERVLRPDAQLSRRLRESIQSEMYDDIVFERERLGER